MSKLVSLPGTGTGTMRSMKEGAPIAPGNSSDRLRPPPSSAGWEL